MKLLSLAALAACFCSGQDLSGAQPPNNYADAKSWLCRPGQHDACDVDLTTTVIAADGKLSRETWKSDANATIDCFYVYPTVSTDRTPNSDMNPDPAEMNVIKQQFARFGSKCRVYAPLYRQISLAGLRSLIGGTIPAGVAIDKGLHYDDVRDAWNYYLEHDNQGRGFVLVGHSQGSYVLAELVKQEIDGKPVQARMVSAILPGATIPVAKGKDIGGKFQHIPLCHSAAQTGCLIAYSAFRSTIPPPVNTRFGKVADPALAAACVNPAALVGASGELRSYLSVDGLTITSTTKPKPWLKSGAAIETPWVSVPGLLTAKCATNEYATYLEITVHGDPAGPRTDDIVGDLGTADRISTDWGLHLVDVNLAMGNLVDIVGQQAKAYLAAKPAK